MELLLKKKLLNTNFRIIDFIFFISIAILGFYVRYVLFPIRSGDYELYLQLWMAKIREYGGFSALKYQFSDYNVPYLFLLTILTYLPIGDIEGIKIISVFFDYLAAILIMKIIYDNTLQISKSLCGFAVTLFVPTILVNSSVWAQCDIIYTFFLLLCLYCIIKQKGWLAIIYFALAFSFKLQAIFVLPVIILMLVKGRIRFIQLLAFPITFFVSVFPAILAGRSIQSILDIYVKQTKNYSDYLTANYPNFYTFTGAFNTELFSKMGVGITIMMVGCIVYYVFYKEFELTSYFLITLTMFITGVIVFFLPHMHERYGFLLDLLSIPYCFLNPRQTWISVSLIFISIVAYSVFLFSYCVFPHHYIAVLLFVCITFLGKDLYSQLNKIV